MDWQTIRIRLETIGIRLRTLTRTLLQLAAIAGFLAGAWLTLIVAGSEATPTAFGFTFESVTIQGTTYPGAFVAVAAGISLCLVSIGFVWRSVSSARSLPAR